MGLAALVVGTFVAPAPASADPPPLPAPHPDYTVNSGLGDIALCGVFHFGTLTIDSGRTLSVATAPNPAPVPVRAGEPPKARCTADEVGSLTIISNRIVNNGTIDASATQADALQPEFGPGAVYTGDPATGNGGGGHAGAGGDGSQGAGGDAYADPAHDSATRGMPGAGVGGGRGGGSLTLIAERELFRPDPQDSTVAWRFGDIQSAGVIRANGGFAADDTSGTCGHNDTNPDPDVNNEVFTSGVDGRGGGGAGGGIVLQADRLDLSGPVEARGGDGGYGNLGGGGGGGGGSVRLTAPVQQLLGGFAVDVSGGAPGGACTTGHTPMPRFIGVPGGAGLRIDDATPRGAVLDPPAFWNRGIVTLPIDAAGSYGGSLPSGFTAYLCGVRTDATAPAPTPPASNSAASPCGSGVDALASKSFSVLSVQATDANGFINASFPGAANDGYWHLWLAVVRGEAVSPPPAATQVTIGVDNTPPAVEITSPAAGFETFTQTVDLVFTHDDPVVFGVPSLVATVECRNELPAVTAYQPCAGDGPFQLSPGYGPKRIGVRVTDHAGNETTRTVSGSFLNSPPVVAANAPTTSVDEGTTATMTGTVSDVESVTLSASTGTVVAGPSGTWSWSRATSDGPTESQTVTITATDALGASAHATFQLVVANVAPSVTIVGPPAGSTFEVGQAVPISASFGDPGAGDTHTASIAWGDGATTAGAVVESHGSGSVTGSHAYAAAGTYVITATVLDDDGGSGSASRTISVRRIATSLTAEPALLRLGPGLSLNLYNLKARLTRADTGAPIAGQIVTMTAPRLGGGAPVAVCSAKTGADGWATCNGAAQLLPITLGGYQADYAGSASYEPASAKGDVIVVRLRLL